MTKTVNGNGNGSGKARQTKQKKEDEGDADVGRIRDILFGDQMQEYERRFKTLETNLDQRVSAAIAQAQEKHDELRRFTIGEFDKLLEKHNSEISERAAAIGRLETRAKEMAARIDDRIVELDEHLAKENTDIRHEVVETHNQVVAETKALFQALDEVVQQATEELRDTKADRTELAGLFKSFALTLSREFDLPDA